MKMGMTIGDYVFVLIMVSMDIALSFLIVFNTRRTVKVRRKEDLEKIRAYYKYCQSNGRTPYDIEKWNTGNSENDVWCATRGLRVVETHYDLDKLIHRLKKM